jgi:hypothetical protein
VEVVAMLTASPVRTERSKSSAWGVAARIVGTTASIWWIFVLVVTALTEGLDTIEAEGMVLGALILFAVIGVAIGFAREDTGGVIALVAGVALAVFAVITAGRNHWLAVLVSGGPFILTGVLFLLSAHRNAQQGHGSG